jgi:hypothetical protein
MPGTGWTSPADVRGQVSKRFAALLSSWAAGQEWSPFGIVVRGPGSADLGARFDEARKWAGEWERAARGPLRVEYKKVGGRSFGVNEIPCKAWIDGYEQAWELLGAAAAATRLAELVSSTKARCPRLVPWLVRRPLKGLELSVEWGSLLATVGWIEERQVPGMYLRQVDVPGVDTKFLERHRGVLAELLDLQLPPERIDTAGEGFEGRYGFRRKPGYVRFRRFGSTGFTELAVRADELTAPPPGTTRVYIVENEVTYLAFPLQGGEIVIFGGGYAVGLLESLAWLVDLDAVYWGDIDTHGFVILDRLRRHFPRLRSVLMDRATLAAHPSQWVTEATPTSIALDHLTPPELELYRALVAGEPGPAVRLEQERVGFGWIRQALVALGH